jgi:putative membrane protein
MPDIDDDPRTYFAEERTFLAWIRTGLGLMGVGFAVARLGLFLRQFQEEQVLALHSSAQVTVHSTGTSIYGGVVLVALGTIVNAGAVMRHIRIVRELKSHTWTSGRLSWGAILLALLLAVFGVGIGIYLLLLR